MAYAPYLLGNGYQEPELKPDYASTPANKSVKIKPLDNDAPGSTGTLSLKGVTNPAHGTASISGDGVSYTPEEDWPGIVTMKYTAPDGLSDYAETITVEVQSVPPTLAPDIVVTGHTVSKTFNVLANDSDPDGPKPLELTSVQQPEHGFLSWDPDGTVTFIPEEGFIGTMTASYSATDGAAEQSSYISLTTIQCFDDVQQDAKLRCESESSLGSADFASVCTYDQGWHEQVEVDCAAD